MNFSSLSAGGGRSTGRGRGGGRGRGRGGRGRQQQNQPDGGRPMLSYDDNNATSRINHMLGGSAMGGGGGQAAAGQHGGPPPKLVRSGGQQQTGVSGGAGRGIGLNRGQGGGWGQGNSTQSVLGGSSPGSFGGSQMNRPSPFGSSGGSSSLITHQQNVTPAAGTGKNTARNKSPRNQKGGRGRGDRAPTAGKGSVRLTQSSPGLNISTSLREGSGGGPFANSNVSSPGGTMFGGRASAGAVTGQRSPMRKKSPAFNFPSTPHTPTALADVFGLSKNLSSRQEKGQGGGVETSKVKTNDVNTPGVRGARNNKGGRGRGKGRFPQSATENYEADSDASGQPGRNQSPDAKGNKLRSSENLAVIRNDSQSLSNQKGAGRGGGGDGSKFGSRHSSPSDNMEIGTGKGGRSNIFGDSIRNQSVNSKGNNFAASANISSTKKGGGRGAMNPAVGGRHGSSPTGGGKGGRGGKGGYKGGKGYGGGILTCRVCQATFTNKSDMFAHLEKEQHFDTDSTKSHGIGQSPPRHIPTCQKCGLTFPSRYKLRLHLIESQHFNTDNDTAKSRPKATSLGSNEDRFPGPLFQNKVWVRDESLTSPPKNTIVSNDKSLSPPTSDQSAKNNIAMSSKNVKDKNHDVPSPALNRSLSIRPDGTVRKEFRERKPGYIPQEEVPAYKPPHLRDVTETGPSPTLSVVERKPEIVPRNIKGTELSPTAFVTEREPEVVSPRDVQSIVKKEKRDVITHKKRSQPSARSDQTRHSDGGIIGQCTDMCPASERSREGKNPRKIDVLEESLDLSVSALPNDDQPLIDHKYTMIKKYEKSSADRNMALPHIVRTPATLLKTLQFMEQNVMDVDRHISLSDDDDSDDEDRVKSGPNKYHVHNFVWDRMRSIYSDFIVQNYRLGGRVDAFCVECHERMARWHLMMEHHIKWDAESKRDGFDRQNSERYISILKSLDEFYNMVHLLETKDHVEPPNGTNRPFPIPNEGELRSYFILYQIDNQGASDKYLKTLRPEVLDHADIQFALRVIQARRSNNYGKFFRLLRRSNYLQGCAMFRFVPAMRLHALKAINKAMRPGRNETTYSVHDLQEQLCFNGIDDALEYLAYFQFETVSQVDSNDEVAYKVVLDGKELEFQVDKDGKEISPPLRYMNHIERKLNGHDRADVSRGLLSNAVTFDGGEDDSSVGEVLVPEENDDYSDVENEVIGGEDSIIRTTSIAETIRAKLKRGDSVTSDNEMENTDHENSGDVFASMQEVKGNMAEKEDKEEKVDVEVQKDRRETPEKEMEFKARSLAAQKQADAERDKQRIEAQRRQNKLQWEQEQSEMRQRKALKKQIDEEKARMQAAERQKAVEAQNMKLKEERLAMCAIKCVRKSRGVVIWRTWNIWKQLTIRRLKEMKKRHLKVIFGVWYRQYVNTQRRREKLDSQLMAINFDSVPPRDLQRTKNKSQLISRARLLVRKRVVSANQDNFFASMFGGQKTSLYAAKRSLCRSFDSQDPLLSPHLAVGSGLLHVQSKYLSNLHNFQTTSALTRCLWSQDLFFHLGIITPCHRFQRDGVSAASIWDHNHCILPNIFRSLLCDENELGIHTEKSSTIGMFNSDVPCLLGVEHDESRLHVRRVNLRVEDFSAGNFTTNESTTKSPKLSGALVILPDVLSCVRNALAGNGADENGNVSNVKLLHLMRHLADESASKRVRVHRAGRAPTSPEVMSSLGDCSDILNTIELFLSGVLDMCVPIVQRNIPIVLILSKEFINFNATGTQLRLDVASSPNKNASFEEVSDSEQTEHRILSIFKDLLRRRTGKQVTNIRKTYCVDAHFLNSDLHSTRNELFSSSAAKNDCDRLSSIVRTCGQCLFHSLDELSLASAPIPAVERVDTCTWVEEVMVEAVWNSDSCFSKLQELIPQVAAGVHFGVDLMINCFIESINRSLENICIKRIAYTLQAVDFELFPFDLQWFAVMSEGISNGGLFGQSIVKGLLYNNVSDRKTASCGPISSTLPVEWGNVDYIEFVRQNICQSFLLPLLNEANCEGSSMRYTDTLVDCGWFMDDNLKSSLDDTLDNLQHRLSDVGGDLQVYFTLINIHLLSFKRLLSRVIQQQCEARGKDLFDEDMFLLVMPSHKEYSGMLNSNFSYQQFLPTCSDPNSARMIQVSSGKSLRNSDSRCKRRLQQDDADVILDETAYFDDYDGGHAHSDIPMLLDECIYESGSKKKKSRHDNDSDSHTDDNLLGFRESKLVMLGEVQQLGEECRHELEESMLFEDKLARVVLEESDGTSNRQVDASTVGSKAAILEEELISWDKFASRSSGISERQAYVDNSDMGSNSLTRQNDNLNTTMSSKSALSLINQFRKERIDVDTWMDTLN